MKKLEDLILTYKDFPKKGIDFKDVLEILQYPDIFHDLILKMSSNQFLKNAEAIISIDARGFIFGSAVALESSKPMIVARKPGKLPGHILTREYDLEYGKNSLSPISPSKTIEGLLGGITCSISLAIFFAFLMNWENPLFVGILYGILISLMALVGDLIESMMKRDAKIKDSGTFLPGHGGILDRIDSYIFTPSVLYYIFIVLKYLN